jgi:hypothetical protein
MYSDAMASFWREWVVNYDAAHQLNLGQQTAHQGHRILEHVRVWGRNHYQNMLAYARRLTRKASLAPGKWTIGVLLAMLASVVLLNARRLWRVIRDLWLAARPEKAPRMAASIWYGKMLRKVARKGWRKQEAQTPVEFANSIQDDQLKRQVAEFTRRYESARFGDSAEDSRRLPELYEKVASSPR